MQSRWLPMGEYLTARLHMCCTAVEPAEPLSVYFRDLHPLFHTAGVYFLIVSSSTFNSIIVAPSRPTCFGARLLERCSLSLYLHYRAAQRKFNILLLHTPSDVALDLARHPILALSTPMTM